MDFDKDVLNTLLKPSYCEGYNDALKDILIDLRHDLIDTSKLQDNITLSPEFIKRKVEPKDIS